MASLCVGPKYRTCNDERFHSDFVGGGGGELGRDRLIKMMLMAEEIVAVAVVVVASASCPQ
jgi:hypothetical protein